MESSPLKKHVMYSFVVQIFKYVLFSRYNARCFVSQEERSATLDKGCSLSSVSLQFRRGGQNKFTKNPHTRQSPEEGESTSK